MIKKYNFFYDPRFCIIILNVYITITTDSLVVNNFLIRSKDEMTATIKMKIFEKEKR